MIVEVFVFVSLDRIRWNAQSVANFGILDENHGNDGSEEQHCCVCIVWAAATTMSFVPCGQLFPTSFDLKFLAVVAVAVVWVVLWIVEKTSPAEIPNRPWPDAGTILLRQVVSWIWLVVAAVFVA